MNDDIRTTHVPRSVTKHKPGTFDPVWTRDDHESWMRAKLLHPAGRERHGGD